MTGKGFKTPTAVGGFEREWGCWEAKSLVDASFVGGAFILCG
eukprot:CAMPEP_0173459242 /NCGR_PEP_ID=MMETSP1357-20121228/61055_1 /TAXON_ID=77926 /ORGANISM="Hemiselmis rufescens, Strain PCC563" /LENGTH=41 /DNA_ID= /DNA_START= /DNA_END= /DNA_ORIENTATION=